MTAQPQPLVSDAVPPMLPATLIAVLLHILVIFGVSFRWTATTPRQPQLSDIEVTVVQTQPETAPPREADLFAPVNQIGGGTDAQDRPRTDGATSPPPTPPAMETEPQGSVPLEELHAVTPDARVAIHSPPPPSPPSRVSAADLFADRIDVLGQLATELQQSAEFQSKRQRRKTLDANTRAFHYAAYLDGWRRKVERIGNLNYPKEAKRLSLYGNLVLRVTLRADGSVEDIAVMQSSGHRVLDQAAVDIVRLAAPYAPFPEDIRAEVELLDIIRTWKFMHGNRLGWSD